MMSPWRALHVTADGPGQAERLLLEEVEPWAAAALGAGAIHDWYLIRPPYDPRTSKALLKLRLRGIGDDHLDELRRRIELHGAQSAAERALAPEQARFGGPEGWAVALTQFPGATRIALATIRRAPAHHDRVHATADLLLASAQAMRGDSASARPTQGDGALSGVADASARAAEGDGGPPAHAVDEAVAWLRQYAAAQAGPGASPPADLARAQAEAEAEARAEPPASGRDSLGEQWFRLMASTWAALTGLREGGLLTAPEVAVFTTLVQMTHNRIGLSSQDNAFLGFLLALRLQK